MFGKETETEDQDTLTVSDIYDSITDEEYALLAKWDTRGKFI